jgi:hypothetical protein
MKEVWKYIAKHIAYIGGGIQWFVLERGKRIHPHTGLHAETTCMSLLAEKACMSLLAEKTCMSLLAETKCMSLHAETICMSLPAETTCMSLHAKTICISLHPETKCMSLHAETKRMSLHAETKHVWWGVPHLARSGWTMQQEAELLWVSSYGELAALVGEGLHEWQDRLLLWQEQGGKGALLTQPIRQGEEEVRRGIDQPVSAAEINTVQTPSLA